MNTKTLVLLLSLMAFAAQGSTQTTAINKVENSGACSFTVVNAKNSIFQVSCGGKGLLPEEAKQLSQILSLIKKDDLRFDSVMKSLQTLAANSTKPSVQQSCTGVVFCNAQSPVEAPQTLNYSPQYGARLPAPEVVIVDKKQLPRTPRPQCGTSESECKSLVAQFQRQMQMDPFSDNLGFDVSVTVTGRFLNPAFRVTCDKPCRATDLSVTTQGVSYSDTGLDSRDQMYSTDDPRTVIFVFGNQPLLSPGQIVTMRVRAIATGDEITSADVVGYIE